MLKQNIDNVMMPPKSHVLETANLEGWVERYGLGGATGFAASPGFGGAPPAGAALPGRSSSGTASMSCSVNDSERPASSFRNAAICSAVTGLALLPPSLRSYVRTSAILWSVKVLSHGCITAVPNC